MAFTRAMLKGMSLTDEQVGAIIEEHVNVTNSLKDQISELNGQVETFKKDADKLASVQEELNKLKKDDWQKKYEKEHKEFDEYKAEVQAKETSSKLKSAYKKLLTECNVGEKHIESILKITDFENMKLTDDGSLENADKLKESIVADWSGFIPSKETHGADVDTPPEGSKPDKGNTGRAAQLAAKYHDNLYGKKEEK